MMLTDTEITVLALGMVIGSMVGVVIGLAIKEPKRIIGRNRNALQVEHDEYEREAEALIRELGGMEG